PGGTLPRDPRNAGPRLPPRGGQRDAREGPLRPEYRGEAHPGRPQGRRVGDPPLPRRLRGGHAGAPYGLRRIERALAATCDHLLWGAADLDVAVAALAERTEVRAAAGGQHPDLGTHNAIAALGRKRFLEVIAPDPTLQPGALARRLAGMKTPSLIMW